MPSARSPLLVTSVLAASAAFTTTPTTAQPMPASERAAPLQHRFEKAVGHDGLPALEDHRGAPVLVVGWRTHIVDGMHAGRFAYDLWNTYGDDGLVVVFTDRNAWRAHPGMGAASFWIVLGGRMPFLACAAAEDREADLPIDWDIDRDDRSLVLLGVDGRVLETGRAPDYESRTGRDDCRRRIEAAIREQLEERRRGWGEDETACDVRAEIYAKRRFAKAAALLESGTSVEHATLEQELRDALEIERRRIVFRRDQGRAADAQSAAKALGRSVAGWDDGESAVATLLEELAGESFRAELKLDKRLQKILRPVLGEPAKGKAKAELLGQLRVFARDHADSLVGQRAARVDHLMHSVLSSRLGMRWDALEAEAAEYVAEHPARR